MRPPQSSRPQLIEEVYGELPPQQPTAQPAPAQPPQQQAGLRSRQELQAYQQLKAQGYKVDWSPMLFYQWVAEQKAKGIRPTFESYMDYLSWVKGSPGLQPGAWTPPPKLPEKPSIEDVKRALSKATSTEQVMSIIEQTKKAGLPAEMAVGYHGNSVGKMVVAVGDVSSGKILEAAFMFRGAGDRDIFDKAFGEVDISEQIKKAQREGFQNVQPAIQKINYACRPEDALRISLVGAKPPPPPPPPKYTIQATNQPGVAQATTQLEVPSFEEFLKQHPEVGKYPEDAQRQLYNIFLLKTAREKGYSYVMTPSGWAQIPDVNLRVDILSSLKQYTNIPQIAYQVWRATEGKEYERVSLLEAGVRGLTAGFTETVTSIPFSAPLLRLGALPEPPVGSLPQVAKATTVPTAIEVAPTLAEKREAMDVLQPPPQLAVYKTMETAGQIAGQIFTTWLPQQTFKTWKSIDVQDVLQRYEAGEKLTLLERLKLEAWIHTPEKIWNALAEATSPKVKYEVPREVEARWARGLGEEGWGGEVWKTEVLSWQEVPKDTAEKLRSISSKVGWLPVKTPKGGIEYVPFAREGVWYAAARGPSWQWLWRPETEWIQYTPHLPRSGVEMRVWRGLGDYTMFAQYTLGEGLWKGAFPKPPIDLGATVEGTVKGVVDIDKILEQAELWKPKLTWIEAHPAIEHLKLGGRPLEPLTVVEPLAEAKVPAAPPLETMKPTRLTLSTPVFSVPVRVTETSFALPPLILPSIPIAPEKGKEEMGEERLLRPLFPVVVKVPVLEEKIEPEFRINVPKPKIEFEEHKREIERFQPFTLPPRLEERLEPLAFAGAMPSVAVEQARRQARALVPIQLVEAAAAPPPSPAPPTSPSATGGGEKGELPGLPYFSPPASSVIYRTPEWRLGEYWRVDWFAKGLKLDFKLGKLAKAFAPKPVKIKQVDWLKPKAKPRVKSKAERKAKTKKKRRSRKREVRA